MKRLAAIGFCLLLLGLVAAQPLPSNVEVYFSPRGGCTAAVVREIGQAKESIRLQAYSFTSAPIAAALIAAKRRGVAVEVIVDGRMAAQRGGQAGQLAAAGCTVRVDAAHAIAHNKVILVDDQVLLTGSFNFTKQAEERNAENLLILHEPAMVKRYAAEWTQHAEHSAPWASAVKPPPPNGAKPK